MQNRVVLFQNDLGTYEYIKITRKTQKTRSEIASTNIHGFENTVKVKVSSSISKSKHK